MATCDVCGEYENLPYQCNRCGQTFCSEHRLPENHDCSGLGEWSDPGGVFDSGFEEGVESEARGSSGGGAGGVVSRVKGRIDRETNTGGLVSYIRGNATYAILAAMWITFLAQQVALFVGGQALHNSLFVLQSNALENVWTVVTSVFAHSPFQLFHIIGNSAVILFFGPLVERAVGSKRFVGFFFVSGILAGLGHVLFAIATAAPGALPTGVLGASGAGFAILGVLTVWRPNMQVLLFFVIPMKIKYLTWGIALISAFLVITSGTGGVGGIAHLAHLIGFAIGLAFGKRNEGLARSAGGAGGVQMGRMRGPGGPGGPGGRF